MNANDPLAGFSDEELAAALAAREAAPAEPAHVEPAQPVDVTQVPAAAGPSLVPVEQPVTIDDLAAQNAALRAQLIAENEKLREALAQSQAAGLSFVGLTDEDVRRLEHPKEFAVSTDELHTRLAAIEAQIASASQARQPAPAPAGA